MNKFAIPALAAAIALGACAEAEAPADETVVVEEPAATETVVVDDETATDEGSSVTIDGDGVDATVSEDGVQADVKID